MMNAWTLVWPVAAVALTLLAETARAQAAELSGESLAQCANHALQLRSQAPRLLRLSVQMENERTLIHQRSAQLKTEAAATPRDDLRAQLELRERRNAYNAQATNFNARMENLKQDINGINVVKQAYERNCAGVPYRRSELAKLSPAAQEAMRLGMADLEVPYIEGSPEPAASP